MLQMKKLSVAFALCGAAALNATAHAADIKVGIALDLSGPFSALGAEARDGFELAIEKLGGKLGGQPAEFIRSDFGGNPEQANQLVARFLQRDGIHFFTGPIGSNAALAVGPALFAAKVPYLSANPGPSAYAGEKCSPWFFAQYQNDTYDEAAGKVAASLKRQIDRGRITTSAGKGDVTVNFTTELADLYIPDVRIDKDNTVRMSEDKLKVSAVATIEVDGLAVGTAPGKLTVKPGLHKLRVVREGYKPWERTVNFTNGQTLNVGLEMSDAGYARWKESTAFINDLKNGAKLTDGQVKVLEGQAKMFENSGFKVNTKEGITINAGPTRSLFGW